MTDIKELISEFAELHNQIKPLQVRYDQIKKELASHASAVDTSDAVKLSNDFYTIMYSKPALANVCTLTIPEFINRTGSYDSLSISISEAKKNLTAKVFNELFTQVPTKTRKLVEVLENTDSKLLND
jgi:hypothetical protein